MRVNRQGNAGIRPRRAATAKRQRHRARGLQLDFEYGPAVSGAALTGGEGSLADGAGDLATGIDPRVMRWRTLETHWQQAHESAAVLSRLLDSRIQAYLDGVGQPPSFTELMSVRSARFREQEARDEADDFMLRMLGGGRQ